MRFAMFVWISLGTTTRVSVSSTGVEGDGASERPDISDDGRLVTFASEAGNLATGDGNRTFDVFVHNTVSGEDDLCQRSHGWWHRRQRQPRPPVVGLRLEIGLPLQLAGPRSRRRELGV